MKFTWVYITAKCWIRDTTNSDLPYRVIRIVFFPRKLKYMHVLLRGGFRAVPRYGLYFGNYDYGQIVLLGKIK